MRGVGPNKGASPDGVPGVSTELIAMLRHLFFFLAFGL